MDITQANLNAFFDNINTKYKMGFDAGVSHYAQIAMTVPSTAKSETYAWLGNWPKLREWIGDRQMKQLETHGFRIDNKLFELTVRVKRTDIEDDQYAIYAPMFDELGRTAKGHPDELIFSLLGNGFTSTCYDGQNFFDTDHPVHDDQVDVTGLFSNMQAGAGTPWYLVDTSRAIKPMIFQERLPYKLTKLDNESDHNVFFVDEYIYGVRARANAGFGLWQLAFGSKAELTVANYATARAAMMSFKSDGDHKLGITPTLLVVPPTLEEKGRAVLMADLDNATSNVWKDLAKLLVTDYLD